MPELSRFFGIVIAMFYDDHAPPHFHVRYGRQRAMMAIETLTVLEGALSPRTTAAGFAVGVSDERSGGSPVTWVDIDCSCGSRMARRARWTSHPACASTGCLARSAIRPPSAKCGVTRIGAAWLGPAGRICARTFCGLGSIKVRRQRAATGSGVRVEVRIGQIRAGFVDGNSPRACGPPN